MSSKFFLAQFNNITCDMKNYLFLKFCNSFYGSQLIPVDDRGMTEVCVAWRKAVRRVWRVPATTHSALLPHITGVMPPELFFAKRAINFFNMLRDSNNKVVRTITGMGIYGRHSVLGDSVRCLTYKYELNE